jgi:hypothetical protein
MASPDRATFPRRGFARPSTSGRRRLPCLQQKHATLDAGYGEALVADDESCPHRGGDRTRQTTATAP